MPNNYGKTNEINPKKNDYVKFNFVSDDSMIKYLSNKTIKFVYAIIMQLKVKHEYFKKFQKNAHYGKIKSLMKNALMDATAIKCQNMFY